MFSSFFSRLVYFCLKTLDVEIWACRALGLRGFDAPFMFHHPSHNPNQEVEEEKGILDRLRTVVANWLYVETV